jgi:hypothetical protein
LINIGLEQQQRIWGADGTILWSGAQVICDDFVAQVATGGTTIGMGMICQFDSTNSVIPRSETTAAGATPSADLPMSLALFVNISPASAGAKNLIGVAQEPIAAGKRGLIAGLGSLVAVQTTATLLVVGTYVGSSATAGLAAVVAALTVDNAVLGAVFKINQVASPGTGSTGWAGILIKGGATAAS